MAKVDWEKTREMHRGRFCVGGIDLSSVNDLTCCVYMFPESDTNRQQVDVLMRTWCPEDKLYDRANKYKDLYQGWARENCIHTTEGDAIDYDFVRKEVVEDSSCFDVQLIGVDRAFDGIGFSMKLGEDLGLVWCPERKRYISKVITCTNHPQKIGPICQELERRLLEKQINHGRNPILRWMADCVTIKINPDGYYKPDKSKSQGKIDGILAMLYALDRLMRSKPATKIKKPMFI